MRCVSVGAHRIRWSQLAEEVGQDADNRCCRVVVEVHVTGLLNPVRSGRGAIWSMSRNASKARMRATSG
jgi:hypothetical protein